MNAALNDGAVHHGEDLIGVANCAQPVSDGNGGALFARGQKVLLDASFGLSVQRTAGLVQNQKTRGFEQSPRQRDTSSLTTAEHGTSIPNEGVDAVLEFLDKLPSPRHFEGCFKPLFGGLLIVDHVVANRPVKQERVLTHETDGLAGCSR